MLFLHHRLDLVTDEGLTQSAWWICGSAGSPLEGISEMLQV